MSPPTARRAIACLSGGLDSGVACALHLQGGGTIARALVFDYGQRASRAEAAAATALGRRLRFPVERVALPWLGRLGGSALTARRRPLPDPGAGALRPAVAARTGAAVWVPARNVVFLAIAAAYAERLGCGCVLAGFNREEAATFPDNSGSFLRAMTAALRLGARTRVRVVAPTLALDKARIAAAALRLGMAREWFWSCYGGGARPCGRCESCRRQARAWRAAQAGQGAEEDRVLDRAPRRGY